MGDGLDWARYGDSGAGVTIDLAAGTGFGDDAEGATLSGDNGVNMIRGGGGDVILEGHGGADTFVFGKNDGVDRIRDFDLVNDLIQFDTGPSGVSGFGDLAISEFNGDATITYGVGDVIVLVGIDSGQVTADLFDFV